MMFAPAVLAFLGFVAASQAAPQFAPRFPLLGAKPCHHQQATAQAQTPSLADLQSLLNSIQASITAAAATSTTQAPVAASTTTAAPANQQAVNFAPAVLAFLGFVAASQAAPQFAPRFPLLGPKPCHNQQATAQAQTPSLADLQSLLNSIQASITAAAATSTTPAPVAASTTAAPANQQAALQSLLNALLAG
ncbi:uncharacterized protein [Halyomorpha halys]|uniref:uncharacterized protein n=1 Tax=Halyomorpha halys TaxID=286706 RepID=UPI0034D2DB18